VHAPMFHLFGAPAIVGIFAFGAPQQPFNHVPVRAHVTHCAKRNVAVVLQQTTGVGILHDGAGW